MHVNGYAAAQTLSSHAERPCLLQARGGMGNLSHTQGWVPCCSAGKPEFAQETLRLSLKHDPGRTILRCQKAYALMHSDPVCTGQAWGTCSAWWISCLCLLERLQP